jgi:hypothetical protein
MKEKEPGILDSIRADAQIKPDVEKNLIAFIEAQLKAFG